MGQRRGGGAVRASAGAAMVFAVLLSGCGVNQPGSPASSNPPDASGSATEASRSPEPEPSPDVEEEAIKAAEQAAAQYDYDAGLDLLEGHDSAEAQAAREKIQETSSEAVEWPDNSQVPHLFFHSLVVDPKRAFAPGPSASGYDDYMVTRDEFEKILESLYERGYVLVDPHDIATMQDDGTMSYRPIHLPPDKKPVVISQDDVSYYEYMDGDGFAADLSLDDAGSVTNTYVDADGETHHGAYDVPTVVDAFVAEHPDFSYRGSRGVLALTGYNGVFGYRTSESEYGAGSDTKDAQAEAREVSAALKDGGWLFASHSWGHINMTDASMERMRRDSGLWDEEVRPILGDTDLMIYPFGADLSGVAHYSGEKYQFLKSLGFDYFFGVDATTTHWVQRTDEYLRQARINVDGLSMRAELAGKRDVLGEFFDVSDVYDPARPD